MLFGFARSDNDWSHDYHLREITLVVNHSTVVWSSLAHYIGSTQKVPYTCALHLCMIFRFKCMALGRLLLCSLFGAPEPPMPLNPGQGSDSPGTIAVTRSTSVRGQRVHVLRPGDRSVIQHVLVLDPGNPMILPLQCL